MNIAPILIIEILGDIKKPYAGSLSKEKVAELSRKAIPTSSAINDHYWNMLTASLLGATVSMHYRPIINGGRSVRDSQGMVGVVFDETPEELALLRWRHCEFDKAEEILGERWRSSTRQLDLDRVKNDLKVKLPKLDIKDLPSLYHMVENIVDHPDNQKDILPFSMLEFGLPQELAQKIFFRWETLNAPQSLASFAPYAHYCLKVNLFFNLGLTYNLIGTRSTNRIDMEYLYYLPFCHAFCSGDKFHCDIAPLFLNSVQSFVRRDTLKADLARLSDGLLSAGPSGLALSPDESVTAKLWEQHIHSPMTNHGWIPPDLIGKQNDSALVNFIKSRCKAETIPDGEIAKTQGREDFVIKNTSICTTDLCPCGSRKLFIECHGKNVKA